MEDTKYVFFTFVIGLVLLAWGIHGIALRYRFSSAHLHVSIAQIIGGTFALIGALAYFVRSILF